MNKKKEETSTLNILNMVYNLYIVKNEIYSGNKNKRWYVAAAQLCIIAASSSVTFELVDFIHFLFSLDVESQSWL
jgi:hypothetical protein